MYCRKCGAEIPDDAVFCPECGERVIKVSQNQKTTKTEELKKNIQKENAEVKTKNTPRKKGGILKPLLIVGVIAVLGIAGKDLFTERFGEKENQPESAAVIPADNTPENTAETAVSPVKPETPVQSTQTTKPSVPNNPVTGNTSPDTTGSGTWEEDQMPKTINDLTMAVLDDFVFPEKMLVNGVPQNAEYLQPYTAEGAWKYELIFEENNYKEIGLCELIFGQYGVSFELYPSQSIYGYDIYPTDRETIGYDTYTGSMRDEDYILQDSSERSTIVLSPFIRIEGTEYAFGSIATAAGDIGSFLFTRP